jgi:hypothetical protein
VFKAKEEDSIEIEKKKDYSHDTVFSLILGAESFRQAFASFFSYSVYDYRQKKPLKYCILTAI